MLGEERGLGPVEFGELLRPPLLHPGNCGRGRCRRAVPCDEGPRSHGKPSSKGRDTGSAQATRKPLGTAALPQKRDDERLPPAGPATRRPAHPRTFRASRSTSTDSPTRGRVDRPQVGGRRPPRVSPAPAGCPAAIPLVPASRASRSVIEEVGQRERGDRADCGSQLAVSRKLRDLSTRHAPRWGRTPRSRSVAIRRSPITCWSVLADDARRFPTTCASSSCSGL